MVFTPFSVSINCSASFKGSSLPCSKILMDNGSKPFSFATLAFVFLFGRYGKYKSSNTVKLSAASILDFNSSVSLPISSNDFKIASLRLSNSRSCVIRSRIAPTCTSSKVPVTSFLYREINGMLAPSSNKLIVASTCCSRTPNSTATTLL